MLSDKAIAILRDHADELRALGVIRLALFGSCLRGDARDDSDIDLLIDLDPDHELSLIDFADLRLRLSDLLGREVDLVQRDKLKPHLRDAILAEARDVV
jgi:uncharacterized protein